MGCLHMLGYELSIHEIIPLEVFLFHLKKKKFRKENKSKKMNEWKKTMNKRPIQLISFKFWKYFNWG